MLASPLLMDTLKYEVIHITAGSNWEQALKSTVTVLFLSTVNWIADCLVLSDCLQLRSSILHTVKPNIYFICCASPHCIPQLLL